MLRREMGKDFVVIVRDNRLETLPGKAELACREFCMLKFSSQARISPGVLQRSGVRAVKVGMAEGTDAWDDTGPLRVLVDQVRDNKIYQPPNILLRSLFRYLRDKRSWIDQPID